MNIKSKLVKLHWIFSTQFGVDIKVAIQSIFSLPRYINDLINFRLNYKGKLELVPCLHDWNQEGGATKSEYFWQDLLVARMIFDIKPEKHVDIGSRIDGFVAHVASFREVEVFDVRPVSTIIPRVAFKQVDFSKYLQGMHDYCDSLSCLHALEHFGLGRYGDLVDPHGYASGLKNMSQLLKNKGRLYLSVPVGFERVEFNANRVFNPASIINLALENSLELLFMTEITPEGGFLTHEINEVKLNELANQRYRLVILTFIKI